MRTVDIIAYLRAHLRRKGYGEQYIGELMPHLVHAFKLGLKAAKESK